MYFFFYPPPVFDCQGFFRKKTLLIEKIFQKLGESYQREALVAPEKGSSLGGAVTAGD